MQHYIERWMTPWSEKVICACENALKTRNDQLEVGVIVVHGVHKSIGILASIGEEFVNVDQYILVGDNMTWVQVIWPRKLTYASSISQSR